MDPDPDFRPIRIRTQAKKVRSEPSKKPGSETLLILKENVLLAC